MLKKLILSSFVVVAFALYIFVAHHEDNTPPVVAPGSLTTPPSASQNNSTPVAPTATYKDGSYTGTAADAFYGNIQVQAVIQHGTLTDVQFLQYPNDRPNSIEINTQAMPYLKQEAIKAQAAQVDIVTGATDSSQAFIESLTSALAQARQ